MRIVSVVSEHASHTFRIALVTTFHAPDCMVPRKRVDNVIRSIAMPRNRFGCDARPRATILETGALKQMAAVPIEPNRPFRARGKRPPVAAPLQEVRRRRMRTPQASEEGTVQRIAVFRALQFGDLLCAVPVLRALRRAHPHAHVTLIGLPSAEAFAHRFRHYIDDWMDFPGSAALPEQEPRAGRLPAFFAGARARRFDLALQLHGSGAHTNAIVRMLGARRSCGFRPGNSDTVDDDDFLPWPEDGSEIERLLRLVDHLGIERQGRSLEFPIGEDERRNW